MRFSDRIGVTVPSSLLQEATIDDALRNGLWQTMYEYLFSDEEPDSSRTLNFQRRLVEREYYIRSLYINNLKQPTDTMSVHTTINIATIKKYFYSTEWHNCYNVLQDCAELLERSRFRTAKGFCARSNFFLEREHSAYRFIGIALDRISDPIEMESVENSLAISDKYSGAKEHIKKAIALYSKRPEPDFPNSIKEAISAVEAAARVAMGNPKTTLGQLLGKMKDDGKVHPAMLSAFSQLYGYTSDEQGIRHSLIEANKVGEAEARFMMVACSSFVSFIVSKFEVE